MPIDRAAAQAFRCPRWGQLPDLGLYMDQVILVLEPVLAPLAGDGEKVITSTMVNNYVKQRLVPPPDKKKYQRPHLARLVVVSVMKRVLSMGEITSVVDRLAAAQGIEAAYDLFCDKLEQTVADAFCRGELHASMVGEDAVDALSAALAALGGKLLVQSLTAPEAEDQA